MKWRGVLGLGLLLAACGGGGAPDTDCENPETVAERVRFASIVLLGTVTEWDGETAQLEIDEIWRGPDLPEKVEIVPERGRAYTAGVRYLVFPTDSPSPLADARCSATTRWNESLAEFKPTRTRVPGTAPAEDADLPWEWVIAAAVLAGGYAAIRRVLDERHRPKAIWNPDHRLDDDG
ncbi:hypothetical protein ACFLRH_03485 [Actinomycetota bacterium]